MNNEFEEVTPTPRNQASSEHKQNRQQAHSSKTAEGNTSYSRNGNSETRSKRQSRPGASARRSERSERRSWRENEHEPRRALPYHGPEMDVEDGFKLPFDPMRFAAALKRHWGWLAVAACVLAMAGLIAGSYLVKYKVNVELIRRVSQNVLLGAASDPLQPREYSDATMYSFMKSTEVLRRTSEAAATNQALAGMGSSVADLAQRIAIRPTDNPDTVIISLSGLGNIGAMADLANMYAAEVVRFTSEIQRREASEVHEHLKIKMAELDQLIAKSSQQLRTFASGPVDFEKESEADYRRFTELQDRALKARFELQITEAKLQSGSEGTNTWAQLPVSRVEQEEAVLQELLTVKGFKEKHPDVIRQRQIIANIRKAEASGELKVMNPSTTMVNNPMVQRNSELRTTKSGLERELAEITKAIAEVKGRLERKATEDKGISYALAKAEFDSLKASRQMLQQKYDQTGVYAANSMGYFRVNSPANAGSVSVARRWVKVGMLGAFAAFCGLALAAAGVMLVEAMDTKLKTPEDIERITNLPVLASLGDLRKMTPAAQVNWAFRTLTVLKGKLSADPNEALVCGIISSSHGEGRSTWVNLLVSAASQRGLRVLTVDTRPTSVGPAASAPKEETKKEEEKPKAATESGAVPEPVNPGSDSLPVAETPITTMTTNVLSAPGAVAEQLTDPNSQPVVHIPLPGWVWNLERRKQWKDAMEHWRKIDNLVIFVELPPASQAESVLLSEHLPQLIWLVGSGMADPAETTEQLSTLRHARCNLVGAVLNQAPPPVFNSRLARWFSRATAMMAVSATLMTAHAQKNGQAEAHRRAVAAVRANVAPQHETVTPLDAPVQNETVGESAVVAGAGIIPQEAPVRAAEIRTEQLENSGAAAVQEKGASAQTEEMSFSGGVRKRKAKWQEKLTLGRGDTFDIHFYGNAALSRTNIFVGPDGRISYLQVQGLQAEGLSIEELRAKLDEELVQYYTAPRTIIIPVSFTSKRYYMLGKVASKGMYQMDRPVTIVEAVARAKGLETGLYQRNSVEMADLSRSFIVRDGEKLSVNLEKLFLDGDLSQNVVLEPNDYLYFESASVNEIYVLGEIINPGPLGFVPNATVITAITDRGGYTEKAYKRKVLVVRGSLNQPETFVVDTGAILDATNPDFKLQARDIVYVSRRPWSKVEELLDEAAQSFIQGSITAWAGVNAGPIIKTKLFPTFK